MCSFLYFLLRNVNNTKGFARETLVALEANIELEEWCNAKNRIPVEHPQSPFKIVYVPPGLDFVCCNGLR